MNDAMTKFRDLPLESQKAVTVRTRLLEEVLLRGDHGFVIGGELTSPFQNPVKVRHFSSLKEAVDEYREGMTPLLEYIDCFDPEDLYVVFAISLNACDAIADSILKEQG